MIRIIPVSHAARAVPAVLQDTVKDKLDELVTDPRIIQLRQETREDEELQLVMQLVQQPRGWPEDRREVPSMAKPYFDYKEELNVIDDVIDGILYKGQRIVIPKRMRAESLQVLHQAHQGIVKSKQLARDLIYWPGIGSQIEDTLSRCVACQEKRAAEAREPLIPTPVPHGSWSHVGMDLFESEEVKFLIFVNYFSEYFERLEEGTHGKEVIRQTKKWCSSHGIPLEVTTDNSPPFNSAKWKDFAKTYGFHHTTSSHVHPQANGMAEKVVSIAKNMVLKCLQTGNDPYLSLLNTPRNELIGSPAQRLFGRRTRTALLMPTAQLNANPKDTQRVKESLTQERQRAKYYYDPNTIPLKPPNAGETVRV